jgi:hypothetical protein
MKTLFKVVIAVLVLNASARGAWSMWTYYQFKDAAQQIVLFGHRSTPQELHDGILAKAEELQLPVNPEEISVYRDGVRTIAEGTYTQSVEFFPNYTYPVTFNFRVDAVSLDIAPVTGRRK